jgi:tetratricopeptide (TPR) repeat protein
VVAIATRILISALILTAPLAVTALAMAQGVTARAYTAGELNLVYSLTYQSSQAQAALARQYSARLNQQKRLIDSKDAALGAARRAAQQSKASVDALEREIGTLKAGFIAELAAKDADFARERDNLEAAANDLLKTTEGKRALEVYLTGGPGSAEAAIEILQRVTAKRNAADRRATAALGLDARGQGRLTSAFVLKLYEDVVAADPCNHWDWVELTRLYQAMNRLERAKYAAEQAIKTASGDRDRSVGFDELGDILVARNDLGGALLRYEEGLGIRRTLAKRDPSSASAQQDVSVSLDRVGNILVARNDLGRALSRYEEGLGIARTLAKLDPLSASAQRDVLVSLSKVGDILVVGNDLGRALSRYEEGLGIARTLAKLDPSSASAQRDVSVSLNNVGDILVARNNLGRALLRYEEGLGIARTLAKLDPSSAAAQRDVSMSLDRVGDILVARNDLGGALSRYEEGFGIRRSLAKLDPSSALAQRDVFVSLYKLASIGSKYRWSQVLEQLQAMQSRDQISPSDLRRIEEVGKRAAAEAASVAPK